MARNRRRQLRSKSQRDRPLRLESLEARHLLAGQPVLVRDINVIGSTVDVTPREIVGIGSFAIFSGDSPQFGREPWRTDGTPGGTMPIVDLVTGSSNPHDFVNVGGVAYFVANTSLTGDELWRTDGTAAGTVFVKNIRSGAMSSEIRDMINVGGMLFFVANNGVSGEELWKTDGTEAGTVIVREFRAGSLGIGPRFLTEMGGLLYFNANDGASGHEIWKTDGTPEGTTLVHNIRPGAGHADPRFLTNVNGTLYFSANDGTGGYELWRSGGSGAFKVREIRSGIANAYPAELFNAGGTLYFTAVDDTTGRELWKSDGTDAGTVRVKDIRPGAEGSTTLNTEPPRFVHANNTLIFVANDGSDTALWRSDGTEAGTTKLLRRQTTSQSIGFDTLTSVGDLAYFAARVSNAGNELWSTDGTVAGTKLAADIVPGSGYSNPMELSNVGGTLYFSANDGVRGRELWRLAPGGSAMRLSDNPVLTNSSNPQELTAVGDAVYFSATSGSELWKSDGTAAGTGLVQVGGRQSSNPSRFTNVGGTLFFTGTGSGEGEKLWKIDGTTTGVVRLGPGPLNSNVRYFRYLTNANGTLFFVASSAQGSFRLWKSDGTIDGTLLIESSPVFSKNLTNIGGTIFFVAFDPVHGQELWKSDGSLVGTELVRDIAPGGGHSDIRYLTDVGGVAFFTAQSGNSGHKLWRSDGTELGTFPVSSFGVGTPGYLSDLVNVDGVLYFRALGANFNVELWKSDGTTTGTVKVKDIGAQIEYLTNVGGTLYFSGAFGRELWKSDGSEAGTVRVTELRYRSMSSLVDVNGTLYFNADDGTSGKELWKSDGTSAGTVLVGDIRPSAASSDPRELINANGELYFAADDGIHGVELWTLAEPPPPQNVVKIAHNTNGGPTLANNDTFGNAAAAIGDLDGDGVTDLAVGAESVPYGQGNGGSLHVLYMNANGTVKRAQVISSGVSGGPTLADGDYFGRSVTALGDLDGDGVTDLAVGADKDDTGGISRGAVYVLFMKNDGTVKATRKIAHGTGGGPSLSNFDRFGSGVAGLGDLDGDGVEDLAVGADEDDSGGSNRGAVYVLFLTAGGTVRATQKIASGASGAPVLANGDYFGVAVASLGDIDGDGRTDLAVGAPGDDTGGTGRGAAHIVFLNADGTAKISQKIAHAAAGGPLLANEDFFGSSVGALGDLDGDGVTDLGVGARYDDTGGANRGALYVLLMNPNGTVKHTKKIAQGTGGGPAELADGDAFSKSIASLGDLNGDGRVDLAVGAEKDDTGGTNRGAVYVLFQAALSGPEDSPGDFNSDGVVNAADLAKWKLDFGVSAGSDADFDGDTDGNDFLLWQRNLGRVSGALAASRTAATAALAVDDQANVADAAIDELAGVALAGSLGSTGREQDHPHARKRPREAELIASTRGAADIWRRGSRPGLDRSALRIPKAARRFVDVASLDKAMGELAVLEILTPLAARWPSGPR